MDNTSSTLWPSRKAWIISAIIALVALAILFAMGRPPICACGTVKLWYGVVESAENSQHIADWYTPSHFIHGLLFYAMAWAFFVKWRPLALSPKRWGLQLAVLVESVWEVFENTPFVIDRYRAVTVSWGYAGDSIINSMSDIGWMTLGFLFAARVPWWVSVGLAVVLEVLTGFIIRDGLALNILMLVAPFDAVREWQAMA